MNHENDNWQEPDRDDGGVTDEPKFQFFKDGIAGEVVDLETLMVGNEDNALSDWCVEADVGEERELAAPYADVVLKRVA